MEETPTPQEAPTISEVLRGLAEVLEEQEGTLERLVVQRAGDTDYPARLYVVGDEDYIGAAYRS